MEHIYLVEDDRNIRELIVYALQSNGFRATGFSNAGGLYEALRTKRPSLLILDIMLDGEDGYQILQRVKSEVDTAKIPVIMLTAKTSEYDKVRGLDMGADDYITKPFGVMEFLSRVRAVLRRSSHQEESAILSYRMIQMDLEKRRVEVDGKEVNLTYKEFELLYYLLMNVNVVLSRDRMMNEIWGYEYVGETRTVDVHIRSLRKKLGIGGELIRTVRNVGYTLGDR